MTKPDNGLGQEGYSSSYLAARYVQEAGRRRQASRPTALVKSLVQQLNGQASLGLSITGATRGQSMHVYYKPKSK